MRPAVADFINGFNSGFAITNVNLSVHYRQRCHCTYLQRCEHKHYVTESSQISVYARGGRSYQIYFPSVSRSKGQDPGSGLR
jgi:hypothetical protein